ncbi:hypothetical protein ACTXL8_05555 [Glutamicibacter arilaitensis]|uniref:hypothetical protein n=1 Tax=Glutamicibacter arilaitensis TaxID=256701 RepID=UPI003FD0EEBF
MSKHYEPDASGLAEVARSPKMQAAMVGIATAAAAGGRAISPVDSGEYRDSFRVVPTTNTAGWKREKRAAARIENVAPHAAAVERRNKILSKLASIIESG